MKNWEPIVDPVTWTRRPLVSFRRARTYLESELGPPQARDVDSNGCGPYDLWPLRFACGLEVLLLGFHLGSDFEDVPADRDNWIEIQANNTDFAHIMAHLPLDIGETAPWSPELRTSPAARWIVMRQDDNGNIFEVHACTSQCETDIRAAALESLGHKQAYWVVERIADAG